MISYEPHPLAGENIEERRQRIERSAAKRRRKNREAMIPDMEPEQHEPLEWFAEAAFHRLVETLGRVEPVDDWSEDGGGEREHEEYLAARRSEAEKILNYLREASIESSSPHHNGILFAEILVKWPDRIPGLKTWAGQQSLVKIMRERQKFLRGAAPGTFVMDFEAPLGGASGFDRRTCQSALDIGFSPNKIGMKTMTRVGMEMLAVLGLEMIPITVRPDGNYEYEAGGKKWAFTVESRNDYYGRWGRAEEVR